MDLDEDKLAEVDPVWVMILNVRSWKLCVGGVRCVLVKESVGGVAFFLRRYQMTRRKTIVCESVSSLVQGRQSRMKLIG